MAGYLWSSTPSQPLEKDSLAGFVRQRDPTGILALGLSAQKFVAFGPEAVRGLPLARVSRLRLCFVVPAVTDIATWRKPQNMLVQTNRAGARLPFRFWLSSVNTTVACSVM